MCIDQKEVHNLNLFTQNLTNRSSSQGKVGEVGPDHKLSIGIKNQGVLIFGVDQHWPYL